jgi:hypothetical protein
MRVGYDLFSFFVVCIGIDVMAVYRELSKACLTDAGHQQSTSVQSINASGRAASFSGRINAACDLETISIQDSVLYSAHEIDGIVRPERNVSLPEETSAS